MPRQADPQLEQRILEAANKLQARGGAKALTMRAVAKAAGTTTPTIYERYRNREDILRALRIHTRVQLFARLSRARTLSQICQNYLEFALENQHAYEVLFDKFAQPPSLHEPWPSFNLLRRHLAQRLGGTLREHNRTMLSLWSLMHGTAMLLIRGGVAGPLRRQMFHSCLDGIEAVIAEAGSAKDKTRTGPKWPSNLVLGEAADSKVVRNAGSRTKSRIHGRPKKRTPTSAALTGISVPVR